VLAVAEALFVCRQLHLSLVNGLINAPVKILALVVRDKGVVVIGVYDDFGALLLGFVAVKDDFHGENLIVKLLEAGGFVFGVLAYGGSDLKMTARNGDFHV
jgi:hypothetical protein